MEGLYGLANICEVLCYNGQFEDNKNLQHTNHRKSKKQGTDRLQQAATKHIYTWAEINLTQKFRCHFGTNLIYRNFLNTLKKWNLLNENIFVPSQVEWDFVKCYWLSDKKSHWPTRAILSWYQVETGSSVGLSVDYLSWQLQLHIDNHDEDNSSVCFHRRHHWMHACLIRICR